VRVTIRAPLEHTLPYVSHCLSMLDRQPVRAIVLVELLVQRAEPLAQLAQLSLHSLLERMPVPHVEAVVLPPMLAAASALATACSRWQIVCTTACTWSNTAA
jgi:hypothetical protein